MSKDTNNKFTHSYQMDKTNLFRVPDYALNLKHDPLVYIEKDVKTLKQHEKAKKKDPEAVRPKLVSEELLEHKLAHPIYLVLANPEKWGERVARILQSTQDVSETFEKLFPWLLWARVYATVETARFLIKKDSRQSFNDFASYLLSVRDELIEFIIDAEINHSDLAPLYAEAPHLARKQRKLIAGQLSLMYTYERLMCMESLETEDCRDFFNTNIKRSAHFSR